MIDQTKASLLLLEIFIWIYTGTFFHAIYERSGMVLICYTWALTNLGCMFLYIPQSRQKFQSAFNAYSWIYLVHFGINSFITSLSSFLQKLHAMNFVEEIIFLPTLSANHLHICFVCAKISNYVYKQYYMTRNVTVETQINTNAIIFDDGDCAICLSPHVNASRPQCGHTFCSSCLRSWCRIKTACPICKQPIKAITSERTPNYEDGDDRFDKPRLFNFNVDPDLLNHEMFEIFCETIMFVKRFILVWILGFLIRQ
jgi:hypothetical protein